MITTNLPVHLAGCNSFSLRSVCTAGHLRKDIEALTYVRALGSIRTRDTNVGNTRFERPGRYNWKILLHKTVWSK
jgi:hypothetical protein